MSAPGSRACPIRATSGAKETDHLRIAGIPGFYELLEALADPNHPNHAAAKEWSDDYDPNTK
jgi:hypothetical protein